MVSTLRLTVSLNVVLYGYVITIDNNQSIVNSQLFQNNGNQARIYRGHW
jgi:hypothetical protein